MNEQVPALNIIVTLHTFEMYDYDYYRSENDANSGCCVIERSTMIIMMIIIMMIIIIIIICIDFNRNV